MLVFRCTFRFVPCFLGSNHPEVGQILGRLTFLNRLEVSIVTLICWEIILEVVLESQTFHDMIILLFCQETTKIHSLSNCRKVMFGQQLLWKDEITSTFMGDFFPHGTPHINVPRKSPQHFWPMELRDDAACFQQNISFSHLNFLAT